MQITDLTVEQRMWPLLRQAFRPFFLLGASFSVIAMVLWLLGLERQVELPWYGHLLFWHSHEMLFGFVSAIVVGFLLTAVQNWTGLRATHGKTLLVLVLLWLLGRLSFAVGQALPAWVTVALDMSFLPSAALLLALPLVKIGQSRNLFFVPVLLLLTLCNGLMHYGHLAARYDVQRAGITGAILLITLLIAIIGGRVIPMFTANGTQTPRVNALPWLDRLALAPLWAIVVLHLTMLSGALPAVALAALYAIAGVALLVRCLRWRFDRTLKVPLVWSLHLAYLFIPLGLLSLAWHYFSGDFMLSRLHHWLLVGAMGSMILSMMARVSLGHSGRPLTLHGWMPMAFALLIGAAVVRVLGFWLYPENIMLSYWVAGVAWIIAYLSYVVIYWPILTRPRADGRPG
ncbi:NnrS family protein [Pseudidiomarina sediminum]|uniref:NnrS family protein n=1 Tax=Pseudidiomarina sediminum TaxID=431675 RepID=A0A432Z349_9GAMM|nr:NnrS family protein [Pseudidiomarina sediminum]